MDRAGVRGLPLEAKTFPAQIPQAETPVFPRGNEQRRLGEVREERQARHGGILPELHHRLRWRKVETWNLVEAEVSEIDGAVLQADRQHVHRRRGLHVADAARVAREAHDERAGADVPQLQLPRCAPDYHFVEVGRRVCEEGGLEGLAEVDRTDQLLAVPVPDAQKAIRRGGQ